MLTCRPHRQMGLLLIALAGLSPAEAAIVFEFDNGGKLDGHTAGETAAFPPESATGTAATLTTHGVANADGTTSGGKVNETSGSLGINSDGAGDDAAAFEGNESWTFSWDVDTALDVIRFDALYDTETFLVRSSAWQGKSYTTASDSFLDFDTAEGEFTFNDGRDDDLFDLTELVSGDSLLVSANTSYTFAFPEEGDINGAEIGALSFSAASAVPEPSAAAALLAVVGMGAAGRVWRGRRRTAADLTARTSLRGVDHDLPPARLSET